MEGHKPTSISGASVSRSRPARIVFGTQRGRAHRRDNRQELLECHMEIEKSALAENPSKVVENLIGNHRGKSRRRRDRWERPGGGSAQRLERAVGDPVTLVNDVAFA